MKQLQTEDASWNGLKEIVILETWGFFWLISGTTLVHVAFWILFRTNTVLPCKRERKALLYNLTPQRYIWGAFFFSDEELW